MLNLKSKKVWFEDALWDVIEVFSPNKHDDYILVRRECERTMHDGGEPVILMSLIDAHNGEFFPSNAETNRRMKAWGLRKRQMEFAERMHKDRNSKAWLECVRP